MLAPYVLDQSILGGSCGHFHAGIFTSQLSPPGGEIEPTATGPVVVIVNSDPDSIPYLDPALVGTDSNLQTPHRTSSLSSSGCTGISVV